MKKPHLYYLVIPSAKINAVRDLMVLIGDGGEAERQNFSIPITSTADETKIVAYSGGTGPLDDAKAAQLESALASIGGIEWFKCNNEPYPYAIKKTTHKATDDKIELNEKPKFEFQEKLTELGHKVKTGNAETVDTKPKPVVTK